MNNNITIKNLDKNIVVRLQHEAEKLGMDLNSYMVMIIRRSLGLEKQLKDKNGSDDLSGLAGTWTQKEYEEFLNNTSRFNDIDEQLWQ